MNRMVFNPMHCFAVDQYRLYYCGVSFFFFIFWQFLLINMHLGCISTSILTDGLIILLVMITK